MKELFHITPNTTGPGFHMALKTGEIDVPDACGGMIVSSGMGSGKTESIKSLIRQKYDEGILYCVDTKEELKMLNCFVTPLAREYTPPELQDFEKSGKSYPGEFRKAILQIIQDAGPRLEKAWSSRNP